MVSSTFLVTNIKQIQIIYFVYVGIYLQKLLFNVESYLNCVKNVNELTIIFVHITINPDSCWVIKDIFVKIRGALLFCFVLCYIEDDKSAKLYHLYKLKIIPKGVSLLPTQNKRRK